MTETNDQILLEKLLQQERSGVAPDLTESQYFELFVSEQVLKNYDLSYDEIESCLTAGGGDGGIDAMYVFVNGGLVSEDTRIDDLRTDITISLAIIQAKAEKGFREEPINKLLSALNDLLNLSRDLTDLKTTYNERLLTATANFRRVVEDLASRFPRIQISCYYATKGHQVHPNVQRKVESLRQAVLGFLSDAKFSFSFLKAGDLLTLARQAPTTAVELEVVAGPLVTEDGCTICLVSLDDFHSFITDPNGELRRWIFEENVRDYQGDVEVNRSIRNSLEKPGVEDFWWLNNGITIIATQCPLVGRKLNVEQPYIVNGLQTSIEIYNHFRKHRSHDNPSVSKRILVRIVVTENEASRSKIITATNRQTSIPAPSFRAGDEIQRNIEQFFEHQGLFYDRRKNYHKNRKRPKDKIISIPYLAQALMAIVLQEPNNSRGRPSTLVNNPKDYERVFSSDYPLQLFFDCAKFMRAIDTFLRTEATTEVQRERNNIRFHLAMFAAAVKASSAQLKPKEFIEARLLEIDSTFLKNCLAHVLDVFAKLKAEDPSNGNSDRIAKSPDYARALKERLSEVVAGKVPLN